MDEEAKNHPVNSTATGRLNSVDRSPGTGTRGKMGKWEESKGENRENFGDWWCLGLVNPQNGKV